MLILAAQLVGQSNIMIPNHKQPPSQLGREITSNIDRPSDKNAFILAGKQLAQKCFGGNTD